jgi:hypothetical protein
LIAPREKCPTSDLWGDRHLIVDRRWLLTAPDGREIADAADRCGHAVAAALPREMGVGNRVMDHLDREYPEDVA